MQRRCGRSPDRRPVMANIGRMTATLGKLCPDCIHCAEADSIASKCFRIVELAEEFGFGGAILGNRAAYPRYLHVMFEGDILICCVPPPDAATKARSHRHPVIECAAISLRLRLPHHDPADRS